MPEPRRLLLHDANDDDPADNHHHVMPGYVDPYTYMAQLGYRFFNTVTFYDMAPAPGVLVELQDPDLMLDIPQAEGPPASFDNEDSLFSPTSRLIQLLWETTIPDENGVPQSLLFSFLDALRSERIPRAVMM